VNAGAINVSVKAGIGALGLKAIVCDVRVKTCVDAVGVNARVSDVLLIGVVVDVSLNFRISDVKVKAGIGAVILKAGDDGVKAGDESR
jgi:hypothetical protein